VTFNIVVVRYWGITILQIWLRTFIDKILQAFVDIIRTFMCCLHVADNAVTTLITCC